MYKSFEEFKAAQDAQAASWIADNQDAMVEPVNSAERHGHEVAEFDGCDSEVMNTVDAIVHSIAIEELDAGFWEGSEHEESHAEMIANQNVMETERWSGRKLIEESECQTFQPCGIDQDSDGILINDLPYDHVESTYGERYATGQFVAEKFERHELRNKGCYVNYVSEVGPTLSGTVVRHSARIRAALPEVFDKAGRVKVKRVAKTIIAGDKDTVKVSRDEQKRRKEARKLARQQKMIAQKAMMEANKAKWNK